MVGYLFAVVETYLACSHASVLVQVRPWRVDDRDVFFLIACISVGSHDQLSSPFITLSLRNKKEPNRMQA